MQFNFNSYTYFIQFSAQPLLRALTGTSNIICTFKYPSPEHLNKVLICYRKQPKTYTKQSPKY